MRFRRENIGHVAHGFVAADFAAVAGGDAGALLAAMLQSVQAEIGQVGGFRMAVDSEHTTLLVQFVVKGEVRHDWCSICSSEVSQGSLNSARSQSSKVSEPQSIRNRSFIVTPIGGASTPFLRAISKTFSGFDVESRIREGPSWNSRNSGRGLGRNVDARADGRWSKAGFGQRHGQAAVAQVMRRFGEARVPRFRGSPAARAFRNPCRAPAAVPTEISGSPWRTAVPPKCSSSRLAESAQQNHRPAFGLESASASAARFSSIRRCPSRASEKSPRPAFRYTGSRCRR